MRLLILGGTRFVGRHVVQIALDGGHEVTLFHRGQTGAELFPECEHILGNRDGEIVKLAGRYWDSVIDTCGYVPRIVRQSVEALSMAVEHYVFVSTISVYSELGVSRIDEECPVASFENLNTETIDGETYGPLKVACEAEVVKGFAGRNSIVRPGIVVGPYDPTDRFTYWPVRCAEEDAVITPPVEIPVQFIDVRDLAEFLLLLAANESAGTLNATGPASKTGFGALIDACHPKKFVAAPEQFLLDCGVEPWTDLPLWIPSDGDSKGITRVDCSRAMKSGLKFRSVEDTVHATLDWYKKERPEGTLKAGMTTERNAELIKIYESA